MSTRKGNSLTPLTATCLTKNGEPLTSLTTLTRRQSCIHSLLAGQTDPTVTRKRGLRASNRATRCPARGEQGTGTGPKLGRSSIASRLHGSSTAHHLFALKKRKATNRNGGPIELRRAPDGKRRDARKMLIAPFLGQSAEAEYNVSTRPGVRLQPP
jgi:hypothetical protein